MVNTNALRGLIAEKGLSQSEVAKHLGITPKTFYAKMNRRVFDSDEIEVMINLLEIPSENFVRVFLPRMSLDK
ncbi:helix-turn-helix domain-containing protein [Selenomonas massiliensis]|uniref:helix-turn-helix domain-containing protein n=1 Tax=Selenomonas massiliensis TaxID=2058293 RepID=UPI000D0ECDD8|nr:helix-turn-helix domain-containing protein [Selenomonas massiliensis]